MNLAQRLLQALARRGATEVFGIPGDFALPLFREIERSRILPLYTFSHEPAVGFAADASTRMRGGLGVAAVTYGAGAFNLVNTVAGAYAERVPLVVLSGAPAAHEAASGYQLHHQVKTLDSQWRVFEELTVDRARLDDARQAPALIARVLDAALRESRPVYLEVPRARRAFGRIAAAGRDRVRHEFRGIRATHRPSLRDPGPRWARGDGPPCLPRDPVGPPGGRAAGTDSFAPRCHALFATAGAPARRRCRAGLRRSRRSGRYFQRRQPADAA